MTICIKCKHHEKKKCRKQEGNVTTTWTEYRCHAPGHQLEAHINPVTGEKFWLDEDEDYVLQQPHCEDVNKGECEHYEAGKSIVKK